jgi:LPXTG-motif cell wall-anchored protein
MLIGIIVGALVIIGGVAFLMMRRRKKVGPSSS